LNHYYTTVLSNADKSALSGGAYKRIFIVFWKNPPPKKSEAQNKFHLGPKAFRGVANTLKVAKIMAKSIVHAK